MKLRNRSFAIAQVETVEKSFNSLNSKLKTQNSKLESGTTLLEVLIVAVLMNILLVSVYGIYNVAVGSWQVGLGRNQAIPYSRLALQAMAEDIEQAKVILSTADDKVILKNLSDETIIYYAYATGPSASYRFLRARDGEDATKGEGQVLVENLKSNEVFQAAGHLFSITLAAAEGETGNIMLFTTEVLARNIP